ncbi:MAG: hypothetical protein ACREMB_19900 [Candidatus Rokuibacteriota bacterium]
MIWILAAVSLLYGVLGEVTEALILPLAGMAAYLHRTQASTEGLKRASSFDGPGHVEPGGRT